MKVVHFFKTFSISSAEHFLYLIKLLRGVKKMHADRNYFQQKEYIESFNVNVKFCLSIIVSVRCGINELRSCQIHLTT